MSFFIGADYLFHKRHHLLLYRLSYSPRIRSCSRPKQTPSLSQKKKKKKNTRCRYRFTVPQILAPPLYQFSSSFNHTSFRINKIVAHPLFVFQVSRPDSSCPGQGIIAVIRDNVRACTTQRCCKRRIASLARIVSCAMFICCVRKCTRFAHPHVERSYVAARLTFFPPRFVETLAFLQIEFKSG